MVELLAPAGSREALIAAVESGANAVYLAGSQFGARAYANNFDEDGLREAIHFAHLRDVLINVTVNTIVDDTEIPALKDYLRFLRDAGADALLVQDLGVARIAREIIPDMPLHASTQMTVHSLEGVLALQEMGFTRVVLSRELSLKEIKYICANSDVEIEVFMHGALCVCYSGQCLMSSMIGGRSGNRGRCAQPCRLPYTLVDEQGQDVLGDKAGSYLLSPRDINTIDVIPDLIGAGVSSLKIEGRMKRPEYVATVVSTYRAA
ncbi:MAG: U32 family peptidase, partial [Selenomonas sp.]|nr:U32 family peptidase [Selenomonas sp.]